MTQQQKDKIAGIVADILVNDGPDGHINGSDIIADYIASVIEGKETEWLEKYFSNNPRFFSK